MASNGLVANPQKTVLMLLNLKNDIREPVKISDSYEEKTRKYNKYHAQRVLAVLLFLLCSVLSLKIRKNKCHQKDHQVLCYSAITIPKYDMILLLVRKLSPQKMDPQKYKMKKKTKKCVLFMVM